jgi:6-pyruvoyltetrahydropterin/6-carboxytetrahydropterin synthase
LTSHLTPELYLSRRYSFAASHRLYSDRLTFDQNDAIFGKCANPNGHGHNYRLTVTVGGQVDCETGFVVSINWLDDLIQANVINVYDHRYLNKDVEDYFELVPTGENIVFCIWDRLVDRLGGKLRHITLDETRNNRFEYSGLP